MEYRQFGRTGVRVSPICLGAFNFGGPTSAEKSMEIVNAALDAGINFIDTANVYHLGRSEEVVAKSLGKRRDDVFLATKVTGAMGQGPNDSGSSRFALFREVERSLKRLKTDHIDLYQLHQHDPRTPLEESVEALSDLVRAGKIRYYGFSNHPAWRITQAHYFSLLRGIPSVSSEQPAYNLLQRDIERDLVPACKEFDIAILPWSPLAMGMLSERFTGGKTPKGARATEWFSPQGPAWDHVRTTIDSLAALAKESGMRLADLAHLWVRDAEGITSMIIGPRTMQQLKQVLALADKSLDAELRDRIDEIAPPRNSMWREAMMAGRK